MNHDGKYSRLYWEVVDDDRFVGIYDNDHHFATYIRLLLIADGAWPASGHLPLGVRRASTEALSDCGLIELLPSGRFRVHGLDSERNARASSARIGAGVRWHGERNATDMPRQDETSIDKTRQLPPTPINGGGSSRQNGTNPRAIAQASATERRRAKSAIHQRYLRGEINEAQERAEYEALS